MRSSLLLGLAGLTALVPAQAAAEAGDLIVRARAIVVAPNEDASDILPAFPGSSVEVEDAVVPELDFTYFFTDRIAAELILATSPHELQGTGGIEGLSEVGTVWALPPTLTVQYHFTPEASFRPYVGAGVNMTIFYREDTSQSLDQAIGATDIELDESFGWAVQAGFDIDLNETWFFNADVKYIDIDTTATLTTGALVNEVDVDLDPVVFGIGIGRRFF